MKLSAFHALLAALALNHASAIALPDPDPEYYVVGTTDNGPVYSNVAPHQRRDTPDITYYPISTDEHGTVYSSVDPNAKKPTKRDDGPYKPVPQGEVDKFIEEQLSCILISHRGKWKAYCHERLVISNPAATAMGMINAILRVMGSRNAIGRLA